MLDQIGQGRRLNLSDIPERRGQGIANVPLASSADLAAASSGLALSEVEVNLGGPRRTGRFTIAGTGMVAGKPVLITQAVGPYTGKGTRADEAEMDHVSATGSVTSETVITAYWQSHSPVRGNFKFNYVVGV